MMHFVPQPTTPPKQDTLLTQNTTFNGQSTTQSKQNTNHSPQSTIPTQKHKHKGTFDTAQSTSPT